MRCPVCYSRETHYHHDCEHLEPDEFWCDVWWDAQPNGKKSPAFGGHDELGCKRHAADLARILREAKEPEIGQYAPSAEELRRLLDQDDEPLTLADTRIVDGITVNGWQRIESLIRESRADHEAKKHGGDKEPGECGLCGGLGGFYGRANGAWVALPSEENLRLKQYPFCPHCGKERDA